MTAQSSSGEMGGSKILEPRRAKDELALSLLVIVEMPTMPQFMASVLVLVGIKNAGVLLSTITCGKDSGMDLAEILGASSEDASGWALARVCQQLGTDVHAFEEASARLARSAELYKHKMEKMARYEVDFNIRPGTAVAADKPKIREAQVQLIRSRGNRQDHPLGVKRARASLPAEIGTKEAQLRQKQAEATEIPMEILKRAGPAAGLNENPGGLPQDCFEEVQKAVFELCSPAYTKSLTNIWLRFEKFCNEQMISAYPPELGTALGYAVALTAQDCGPTVLSAFRTAVDWFCNKLQMEQLHLGKNQLFRSIEMKCKRAKVRERKQSPAWPVEVIKAFETAVCSDMHKSFRIYCWFQLCLIFGSLRWGDALRVKPTQLKMYREALMGRCWQTKTHRGDRFMKFAIPNASFSGCTWWKTGFYLYMEEFNKLSEEERKKVDFWMPQIDKNQELDWSDSMSYNRALALTKFLMHELSKWEVLPPEDRKIIAEFVLKLMGLHGCKATIVDLLVQMGEDYAAQIQGHWEGPEMIKTYAREQMKLPIKCILQLTDMIKQGEMVQLAAVEHSFADEQLTTVEGQMEMVVHNKGDPGKFSDMVQVWDSPGKMSKCSPLSESELADASPIEAATPASLDTKVEMRHLIRVDKRDAGCTDVTPSPVSKQLSFTTSSQKETEEDEHLSAQLNELMDKPEDGDDEIDDLEIDDYTGEVDMLEHLVGALQEKVKLPELDAIRKAAEDTSKDLKYRCSVEEEEMDKIPKECETNPEDDLYRPMFYIAYAAVASGNWKKYKIHYNEVGDKNLLACHKKTIDYYSLGYDYPKELEHAGLCEKCARSRREVDIDML